LDPAIKEATMFGDGSAESADREKDTSPERGTPPVEGTDQEKGQTQHPAPEEDVGAPSHEEIEEREEEAHEEKD
jgi:hypothetical protein